MRLLLKRKGQSTAEYAILIGLVIGALVVMQVYVKRGMQGRMKDATDDYVNAVPSDAASWANITATTATLDSQWEFDQQEARRTRDVLAGTSTTEARTSAGQASRDSVERSQAQVGDYTKYNYSRP
jgi:hypothetical protein